MVLGGGTGGTIVANRMRRLAGPEELELVVVDRDDVHVYQPGLLYVAFSQMAPGALVRRRSRQLQPGIRFLTGEACAIDLSARLVHLGERGDALAYDALVIATGARLAPETTAGFAAGVAAGWVHTFYDPAGAESLAAALESFEAGRLVVDIVDEPIKGPVSPLEFCILADGFFRHRRRRSSVEITLVTPLGSAFNRPLAGAALAEVLAKHDVGVVAGFRTQAIDPEGRFLVSDDDRREPADLAVVVARQVGAAFVSGTEGLADPRGFVVVDIHTLQSQADPAVFAIGDAAALPTLKAGTVAHFAAGVVAENVVHFLRGEPPAARFDGHATYLVETGDRTALVVDFDYGTEHVGGRYRGPIGLPLLTPSRLAHLAKRMVPQLYWRALLPARHACALTPVALFRAPTGATRPGRGETPGSG